MCGVMVMCLLYFGLLFDAFIFGLLSPLPVINTYLLYVIYIIYIYIRIYILEYKNMSSLSCGL